MRSFIASLRANLVAERLIKQASIPICVATTYGGGSSAFTKEEIQEMLDSDGQVVRMYWNADNLPRWIEAAGAAKILVEVGPFGQTSWMPNPNAKKFPGGGWKLDKGWPQISAILQKILASDHVVHVNVDSKNRNSNGIHW